MKKAVYLILTIILMFALPSCNSTSDIPERYIEAITEYKNNLKDPTSMRIYGNIIVATFTSDETKVISVICDAQNSYGGYGGKDTVEIVLMPEDDPVFFNSDSDYFFDIRKLYDLREDTDETSGISEEAKEELDAILTFEVISGEDVAKTVGAEYFSA